MATDLSKKLSSLKVINIEEISKNSQNFDFLLIPNKFPAQCGRDSLNTRIILTNGLIERSFIIKKPGFTVSYTNLMKNTNIIRGIKPEALIKLNGFDFSIGSAKGQPDYAYFLQEWESLLTPESTSWEMIDFKINPIKERFNWKKVRYASNKVWPPEGIELTLIYKIPNLDQIPKISKSRLKWSKIISKFKKETGVDLSTIEIEIHYECYSGLPLLSKWVVINNLEDELKNIENDKKNNLSYNIRIDRFTSEILAIVETQSVAQGDPNKGMAYSPIYMESDYIFSAMSPETANVTSVWTKDPQYTSQVAYNNDALLQLESKPPLGPAVEIGPNEKFSTYRTYELIFDSTDRERRSLIQRKMYRILAPWATENPILMHMITADPEKVKPVIDQCAEVGFEMVILSFGSGINMEWEDDEFYEEFRDLFKYAHSKNIEIGTYSLFSSRSISKEDDVVILPDNPYQKKPTFGKAPCLCSKWGIDYIRKLKKFLIETNADLIEHDGPYPGDICGSTTHPGHKGLEDSQWKQWEAQTEFYKWCREHGIYINAPDWYFLSGSNKTGMGYKEVNWSLPRERQIIIARQNIYDGTWSKSPSMGWMFTPLTVYHKVGDWKKSTLEPLEKYLNFYEKHLAQNFSSGVQSCYRGKELYDSEKTKEVVKKWVSFYKKYRLILDSDIIHIRRPDGQHIDGILHVNPELNPNLKKYFKNSSINEDNETNEISDIPGLLVLNNPKNSKQKEKFKISLYYTGINPHEKVKIRLFDDPKSEKIYELDCNHEIELMIEMEPDSLVWYTFRL